MVIRKFTETERHEVGAQVKCVGTDKSKLGKSEPENVADVSHRDRKQFWNQVRLEDSLPAVGMLTAGRRAGLCPSWALTLGYTASAIRNPREPKLRGHTLGHLHVSQVTRQTRYRPQNEDWRLWPTGRSTTGQLPLSSANHHMGNVISMLPDLLTSHEVRNPFR